MVLATVVGLAVLYVAVLLGINVIGNRLERPEAAEPVGSLDGRFDAQLVLQAQGRIWNYRDGELTNILLIGTDWDEGRQVSEGSRYAGQADFLLLLCMDRPNKMITPILIDRDTLADVRIYGPFGDEAGTRCTQICLSYAFGDTPQHACENTVWSVSELLGGIPIDGYMALSMDGITALNDALGGVTVTLEDDFTHIDPEMKQGATITLHGNQAETFVRGRMNVGEGTNQSRMRRQSAFIEAASERMAQGMSEDMNYISNVLDAVSPWMTTDLNRGWLINRAYESQNCQRTDIRRIAGSHSVGEDGFIEFKADEDALIDLLTSIFFE